MKDEGWFKVHGRIQNGIPEENRPIETAVSPRHRLPDEMQGRTRFEAKASVDISVVRALGGSPLVTDFVMARWHPELRTMEVESPNNPLFHLAIRVPLVNAENKADPEAIVEFEAKTVIGDRDPKTSSRGDPVTVRWDVTDRTMHVRWDKDSDLYLDIPLPGE